MEAAAATWQDEPASNALWAGSFKARPGLALTVSMAAATAAAAFVLGAAWWWWGVRKCPYSENGKTSANLLRRCKSNVPTGKIGKVQAEMSAVVDRVRLPLLGLDKAWRARRLTRDDGLLNIAAGRGVAGGIELALLTEIAAGR